MPARKDHFMKYISFHEDLLKVQVRNMQRLMATFAFSKLNLIDIHAELLRGDHIIHAKDILVDETELEYIFDQIFPVMKKYYHNQDDLKRLEDLNNKRHLSLLNLVKIVLERNEKSCAEFSEKYKITKNIIKKVGEYIASPYLELCSEYFNKKLQTIELITLTCPICGNYPSMALINEKENFRIFWCQLCNTEWKDRRQGCPFCQNQDLSTLKHIFPIDNSPCRIDACDKCKSYIKIHDAHLILKKPNFTVEYLATYNLDVLAIYKGYHKHSYC